MDLSISIVSWNTREVLDQCLKSIYENTSGIDFEVIVVDNASSDGSAGMVRDKYPQARLIENADNVGFAVANNQAFEAADSEFFLLLNPDTVVRRDALQDLAAFLDRHDRAGAVGPLVLNADGSLQYSWAKFPTVWSELRGSLVRRIEPGGCMPDTADAVRSLRPFQVDWVGGCCLMVRRSAVKQIGLMDESFFMYSEETDWCYRLHRTGWEVWLNPAAEIVHLGGQSSDKAHDRSRRILHESKVRYARKHWGGFAACVLHAGLGAKRFLAGRFDRGGRP